MQRAKNPKDSKANKEKATDEVTTEEGKEENDMLWKALKSFHSHLMPLGWQRLFCSLRQSNIFRL